MSWIGEWIERVERHVGGRRVLALPLLRALAVLVGIAWVVLAPREDPAWSTAAVVVAGFGLYSLALGAGFWLRPALVLRLGLLVLAGDLAFALTLIRLGGASSSLYLALLLIAAVQSYYHGMRRGLLVALVSASGYLLAAWPTITPAGWADVVIRLTMLVGTALGVGVLADLEEVERGKVGALSAESRSRERFIRGVLESLREGVVVLDPAGRVQDWNPALEERYGVAVTEVIGTSFLDAFPRLREEGMARPLEDLLAGRIEEFTHEALEHETRHRGRVILNLKGSLLRQQGRPAGAVLLIEDVTHRIHLERSARQSEKLAALGTMATGLAHELNNPIGIISSRIELMLLDAEVEPLPEQMREDLRVLHRNAQRVARIAQGLLSLARQSPGRPGPVDVNHVVDETLLLVERELSKNGIQLRRDLAADLPPVLGDGNALQQVVLNLVTNARDAVGEGGEIVIATSGVPDRPGAVRLVVRDSGPGIAPENLPRIFDPFFSTKAHGTGLGLSISHGIVRDHQGTLDVETRLGHGTTFTVTLPGLTGARHVR